MALAWKQWTDAIAAAVVSVPDETLRRAADEIVQADLIVTAGNGGSSSLASHMAQAIAKPDYAAGGGRPAVCLTDHIPTLTAHSNDGGWADAMVESGRPFVDAAPICALVVFSSSGRSENIVRLARLFVEHDQPIIAFTGFGGEPLRSLATVSVHVDSQDYEVVEPVHDALLHRMQYHLRERNAA